MSSSQSLTSPCRGMGLSLLKLSFSECPTSNMRPMLHLQTRKVLSCKLVPKKKPFRLNNVKTSLIWRKCSIRIHVMEDGGGDISTANYVSNMDGETSSGSEEKVEIHVTNDEIHLETTMKGRLSLVYNKPNINQARSLPGLLITASLSFVIIILLLYVDWCIWQIIRVPLPDFFLTFPFLAAAIITGCLGCIFVPLLRKLKLKQIFREEGPTSHLPKMGTPTMGGLYFVPLGLVVPRLFTGFSHKELLVAVTATLAFGAIGFLDDCLSFIHNHNYGLPGWLKFAFQVIAGSCFFFWWDSLNLPSPYKMKSLVPLPAPMGLLFLGKWYLPLTVFCFAAMANGINLTDGLDGLAGGTAALAFIGMSIAVIPIYPGLAVFGTSMAGACIGFLMHNRYKASIFMGDTGSLALGGALAAMAAISGMFLPLFIASGVFVAETLSVIMQ